MKRSVRKNLFINQNPVADINGTFQGNDQDRLSGRACGFARQSSCVHVGTCALLASLLRGNEFISNNVGTYIDIR